MQLQRLPAIWALNDLSCLVCRYLLIAFICWLNCEEYSLLNVASSSACLDDQYCNMRDFMYNSCARLACIRDTIREWIVYDPRVRLRWVCVWSKLCLDKPCNSISQNDHAWLNATLHSLICILYLYCSTFSVQIWQQSTVCRGEILSQNGLTVVTANVVTK